MAKHVTDIRHAEVLAFPGINISRLSKFRVVIWSWTNSLQLFMMAQMTFSLWILELLSAHTIT